MNKHISKFLLSLTMVLGLTLGLSPTTYAQVTQGTPDKDALEFAFSHGYNVKLEADVETRSFYALDDDITFDLNGHTLSVTWLQCNASVKIIDSSTGGDGVLICSVSGSPIMIMDNGSLTLESGTLSFIGSDNAGISVREGPFTMTGGKIESAGNSINLGGSNVSISGGTIIGNIVGSDGEINITGGTFSFDPSDLLGSEYSAYKSGDFWEVKKDASYLYVDGYVFRKLTAQDLEGKSDFNEVFDALGGLVTIPSRSVGDGIPAPSSGKYVRLILAVDNSNPDYVYMNIYNEGALSNPYTNVSLNGSHSIKQNMESGYKFYYIAPPIASVTIGDATTEYASLTDAFAALEGGSTLTILKDVEHTGDITVSSDATLTIPENVTLTVKGAITIGENCTLHITGGGTLEVIGVDEYYNGDGESAIYLSGTLIVENATVVNATGGRKTDGSSGMGGYGIHGSWGNWYNATGSNVIVDGGIVNATAGWGDGAPGLGYCSIIVKSGMLLATGGDEYGKAFYSSTVSSGKIYQSNDGSSWAEVSGTPSTRYVKVEVAHTHNFIYSAEGATITATCSADECNLTESKATLTIAAPTNLAYSGSAKAATVENNIPDVTTAPSIVYTKDGTTIDAENVVEPGTYTATVTLADVKTGEDTTGEVTASVEFTITNNPMPVALTSSGNGGTAALLNDSYNEVNSLNKKVGEKFILRVNNDDGYNFAISFNTDDVSTTEFTSDEYKAYIEYATENNIHVPANTVLLWVTMPYVESGNLTATVTFAKTKTFTVLYQPQDGANPDVVFCKIAKTEGANEVVGYTPMKHGATMGNTVVWSLAMTSAFDPTKVAFVAANTPSTDEEKIALMTNIENVALSTAIVSQNVEWTDVSSGKYAIIGGNAKVVVAAFVSDANNITTYKDNTLSEAESGDGVTYQFAVCKTDESGVVTEAGTVKVPANTLVKDGYDFAGWRGFEGTAPEQTEKIYSAGDEITISENTILNAIWNRRNLTIALDLNGGTGSSSVNPVAYGTTLTIAANPTRKGYAFDGWTVGEAVTEGGIFFAKGSAFDLSTPITNNLKLTAQWKHVHNYTCYKISAFGSQLEKYKKYESSLHIAVCGCNDVDVVAHSFGANGKCACGLTDPSIPTTVTLDVSYGQWSNGTYTERMLGFPQEAKKNQEVSIDAPHNWGNLQFSKWQYSTNNGASWYDLTAYEIVSFIIPCSMKVRALYVNPVTAPTLELSARQYDDHAEVNGKTYTMDNILFQMNYKLPDGYTFVDGGIKMGDNNGISYYNIQEVKVSYDNECKGIIAGMGAALGAATFFTSGGWDAITSFNEVASHMNDKAIKTNYVETEENVLNKMDATQLAKCMYKGTPINVEKYSPIYWVANAKTKSMSGSMATLPPLRFAQKNNGNHYIYGIGWMTFKTRSGAIYTIYTDALAATINNIPTKSVKKAAPINIGTVGYDNESEKGKLDMSLVFAPETQLNVYVDGEWSADLSGSYGFGDKATISAPEVSGKTFSYWEADGRPVSSSNPLTLTMNAHTTLRAVYDGSAVSAKVGFTSITHTNDKISFQAIADAQATAVGIIYSTTATGDALTLNGEGVTQAAAERLTDATTTMPVSVLDDNNCWMLKIAPDDANTIYHARVYAIIDGNTIFSDVRDVKLADLQSGIMSIANLDGFEEGIDEALTELLKSGEAVARYIVTISGAELDETEANMWSIQPEGGAASGETVTISYNGTRKVKSLTNDDVNPIWNAETKEATFTMPDYNVELKVVYYTQEEIDQAAADAVVALIDALPTEVATTDEEAIVAARTAYDALTEAQKAKVSAEEFAKLTAAESALAQAKQNAVDQAAAEAVVALIDALPTEVATTDEEAIVAARTAYDALTDAQKALVSAEELAKLTAAESALAQAKQNAVDQAAADAVVALIDALPTEVATTDEAAITAARTAYDALTEAQKAKVSAEEFAKLTAAESALAAINEKPTPVVNINADNKHTDVWYDLSGRRLQGKPTTPGLYINNNQKVLVK